MWSGGVGWHRGRRLFPSVTGRRRAKYAGRAESSEGGSDCARGRRRMAKTQGRRARAGQAGGGVLDGRENVKNPSRRGQLRIGPLGNRERERERERENEPTPGNEHLLAASWNESTSGGMGGLTFSRKLSSSSSYSSSSYSQIRLKVPRFCPANF